MHDRRPIAAASLLAATAALVALPSVARAGGFDELPDQGAEAMGRGATFTAKADDATAIYYNVAGLARQRGTKLQISANFHFNSMTFQRAGEYPDDPENPRTPWGGEPFPVVVDRNASFALPMLAVTTDFGYFDRLTFGLGAFGPAATGRTFPLGIKGRPSPARYDHIQSKSTILFPTLGAAYRVTEHLDLGLSAILAVAKLDEMTIAYADSGGSTCKNVEYQPCDAEGRLQAEGIGGGAALGVMYPPLEVLQLGAQVRSMMKVNANGTTTVKLGTGPDAKPTGEPGEATTAIEMPWILRAGARYIQMEKAEGVKRELFDAELDVTFEAWGATASPTVTAADVGVGTGEPTTITSVQNWKNTFSVRGGGAYNVLLDPESTVILRAGAYYDAPTTDDAYTRIATNTLAKVAGTVGIGYRRGGFTVNAAYGAVMSFSRTVSNGEIRPENGAKGGESVDGNGDPLPAVNNGDYSAFSHVLSLGVEVNFESLLRDRKPTFGEPEWENLDSGDAPKSPTRKTDDEDRKTSAPSGPTRTDPITGTKKPVEPPDPPGTWWKPGVPDSELKDYDPESEGEAPPTHPRKKRPEAR